MAAKWRNEHFKCAIAWNRATLKRQAEKTRSHGKGWLTRKRMAERKRRMAQEFGEFTGQG